MDKKKNDSEEHRRERPYWGPEQWAYCCRGAGDPESRPFVGEEMHNPMARCFSCCRHFLLFPVIMGITFLVLGYYLSPEIIRTMWMIGAGMAAGMALLAAFALGRMAKGNDFFGCCGPWPRRNT